ncbi:hypothetical protein OsI_30717 [Oryza sativa Indica Group]|uniref:Uncharacterized protein n=1 Tax=Oryza sativa subsp. indica TaxID=39946 RepID=B8BE09_ORYSI|nr:hypothetical protein OsI_30717 [Oryza sativa Indica Group]
MLRALVRSSEMSPPAPEPVLHGPVAVVGILSTREAVTTPLSQDSTPSVDVRRVHPEQCYRAPENGERLRTR